MTLHVLRCPGDDYDGLRNHRLTAHSHTRTAGIHTRLSLMYCRPSQ
ncbi:hypothetical protein O3Q52_44840 [Streptomyces sp. ActVer]|nr:hypothetical protein [Streptomyces sp. ActVer]MCZ4515127.1 hypothetical protein [Streptomyces sp. ActVer]